VTGRWGKCGQRVQAYPGIVAREQLAEALDCPGTREATMVEEPDAAPTQRRGEALPADHPAHDVAAAAGDCIAEVPAALKDEVAALHGNHEPPDTPIDPRELV